MQEGTALTFFLATSCAPPHMLQLLQAVFLRTWYICYKLCSSPHATTVTSCVPPHVIQLLQAVLLRTWYNCYKLCSSAHDTIVTSCAPPHMIQLLQAVFLRTWYKLCSSAHDTTVTSCAPPHIIQLLQMGGDLQPGCLFDQLLTDFGQPQINPLALTHISSLLS
jgi:hypothetical protein